MNVVRKFLLFLAAASPLLLQAQNQTFKYTPRLPQENLEYTYKWEVYGGAAYTGFAAGPDLGQGSNLGGFDVQGARFLRSHWAAVANGRGYYGSSYADPNPYGIFKPAVGQYLFLAGPEYRSLSNDRISLTLHALFGGAYGVFNTDIKTGAGVPVNPESVGFFKNQLSVGSALGGGVDFNIRQRWALRLSPDAILTNYKLSSGEGGIHTEFAGSVGIVYRLRQGLRR